MLARDVCIVLGHLGLTKLFGDVIFVGDELGAAVVLVVLVLVGVLMVHTRHSFAVRAGRTETLMAVRDCSSDYLLDSSLGLTLSSYEALRQV